MAVSAPTSITRLSQSQVRICELLLRCKTDKEIAQKLCMAVPTIRTHLGRIFAKTGTRSRMEVAFWFHAARAVVNPDDINRDDTTTKRRRGKV